MNIRDKITEKLRALPDWAVVALLMLFALAVCLIYLWEHPLESRDGIYYIEFTRRWFYSGSAALPSFSRMPPPLFCYLGRALMWFGLDATQTLLFVNLFFGVATVIPAYLIGKTIYDDSKAGLWLAAFAAVLPPLVAYSCTRTRECLYVFCLFMIAWLWTMTVRMRKPVRCSAMCGAMVIVAMHCRYEALELLPIAILGLPISVLIPNRQWKKSLWVLGATVSGMMIALALMSLLPGMPNIIRIFYNLVYAHCLGTSLNPL